MRRVEEFSYGDVLDQVRGLRWPARMAAAGLPGRHPSPRRGSSAEFTEYRPYRQGDPVQRIDWKVFARTDRAYIRLADDHAVLATIFVVDASASMGFPEDRHDKYVRACRIATGLASIAHNDGDPVGVIVSAGSGDRTFAPRTRAGVVREIGRTLAAVGPSGGTNVAAALSRAARLGRRVVLISDMLGDFEETLEVAAAERARALELYAVHVLAADELDPPADVAVHDPEDAAIRRTLSGASRAEYMTRFAAWRASVASRCRAAGVAYHESVTGGPLLEDLRRIVARPR